MPLYSFKCVKCSKVKERFFKNEQTEFQGECDCGGQEFIRVLNFAGTKVWRGAKEHLEEVLSEVDKIQERIDAGDDNALLDICGE